MQRKYLIGIHERPFGEGAFRIVAASNAKEAIEKFIEKFAPVRRTISIVYL